MVTSHPQNSNNELRICRKPTWRSTIASVCKLSIFFFFFEGCLTRLQGIHFVYSKHSRQQEVIASTHQQTKRHTINEDSFYISFWMRVSDKHKKPLNYAINLPKYRKEIVLISTQFHHLEIYTQVVTQM